MITRAWLTSILRVLDAEQEWLLWSVPISRLFGKVHPASPDRDADFVVAEVPAVELEELDEECTEILFWIYICSPEFWVKLAPVSSSPYLTWEKPDLQEGYHEADDGVTS